MSYTSCAMADFGPPARKRRASGAGIAAASSELPGSTLSVWLLEMCAWGLLTPQQVQAISERALHDAREKRISDLEPLARLGSSGRHSNNVNRDLVKLVGQLPKMCDPSRITLRKVLLKWQCPLRECPLTSMPTPSLCRTSCSAASTTITKLHGNK